MQVQICNHFLGPTRLCGIRSTRDCWISGCHGACSYFVPRRIATVLRAQYGVLALDTLPAVGFFFVHEYALLEGVRFLLLDVWYVRSCSSTTDSVPLAVIVVCHRQAGLEWPTHPFPLRPGHEPAVGWEHYYCIYSAGYDCLFSPVVGAYDNWTTHRWALFCCGLLRPPFALEVPWLFWELLRRPARPTVTALVGLHYCSYVAAVALGGSSGAEAARARHGVCVLTGLVADEKDICECICNMALFTHLHNMVCRRQM